MNSLKKKIKSKSHPKDLNNIEFQSDLYRTNSINDYLIYNTDLNYSTNKELIKTQVFNSKHYKKDSQLGIYFKCNEKNEIVIDGFKPYTDIIKNYELTKGMVLLSINNKSCELMNYAEAMLYIQYLWKKKENIYLSFLRKKIKQNNSEVFEIHDNN